MLVATPNWKTLRNDNESCAEQNRVISGQVYTGQAATLLTQFSLSNENTTCRSLCGQNQLAPLTYTKKQSKLLLFWHVLNEQVHAYERHNKDMGQYELR